MVATIRDVAAKAKVSFQLASAVLGNKKYARASEATRKKITDAARNLGYVPNVSARILRGDASKIIGVLIDSRAPESTFSILAEIEHCAALAGYRILIAQAHDDPEKLLESCKSLRQNGVDGIISFAHDYPLLNCRLDQQLGDDPKIVFVLNTTTGNGSTVDVDIAGGMKCAVDHLLSNGYRNPALLLLSSTGGQEKLTQSKQKRLDGFLDSAPAGSRVFSLSVEGNTVDGLAEQCRTLIREDFPANRVDAVIAENDNLAAILMKELLAAGIRIPQDFGLVGWDNLLIGQCLPVKLTTLYYDRKEIAENTLCMLLDRINGNTASSCGPFELNLIVRESSQK